jgi:hypothetical protein
MVIFTLNEFVFSDQESGPMRIAQADTSLTPVAFLPFCFRPG